MCVLRRRVEAEELRLHRAERYIERQRANMLEIIRKVRIQWLRRERIYIYLIVILTLLCLLILSYVVFSVSSQKNIEKYLGQAESHEIRSIREEWIRKERIIFATSLLFITICASILVWLAYRLLETPIIKLVYS